MSAERVEARRRLDELSPILRVYWREVEAVLSPFLTISPRPNLRTPVATTDSRGYRRSRVGEATVASDDAPDDATFLLGASYAFGVGAEDDSGTLASALWRRSGRPCVNLGLTAGSSMHELISALPFVDRTTTFIVCSGGSNLAAATSHIPAFDPLLGPSFLDYYLQKLRGPTVDEIVHMVWAARKGRVARWKPGPRLERRKPKSRPEDPEAALAAAAALQLRDLGALRRLVPAEAKVVFALNPFARATSKQLSEEEEGILEAIDVINRGTDWGYSKDLAVAYWDAVVAVMSDGCAELGVPFVSVTDAPYTGWCFLDEVHQNNRGYDIAAEFLLDSLD